MVTVEFIVKKITLVHEIYIFVRITYSQIVLSIRKVAVLMGNIFSFPKTKAKSSYKWHRHHLARNLPKLCTGCKQCLPAVILELQEKGKANKFLLAFYWNSCPLEPLLNQIVCTSLQVLADH